MTRRFQLQAGILAAFAAVLLTACGGSGAAPTPTVSPTPTPTPDLTLDAQCFATEAYALEHLVAVIGVDRFPTALDAQCFATEAYALEHLVAVIGVDRFPTALDAINTGGYSFSLPTTQFTANPNARATRSE